MRQVRFYGHGKARVAHLTIPFARFKINNYDTEDAYEFTVLRDMGYPWEYWPPVKGAKREVFQSTRLSDKELIAVINDKSVSDKDIKPDKSKKITDIPDGVFKNKKEELELERELADKPEKISLKEKLGIKGKSIDAPTEEAVKKSVYEIDQEVGESHTKTIIEDSVKGKQTIIGDDK